MTVFVGPKRALLGSVKPAFLGASGLWGFTASPTPQYAHFGRATNKAGALASGRGGIVYDVDGSGIYNAIPANEASVLADRGFAGFAALTALNANGNNPQSATGWVNITAPQITNGPTVDGFFNSVYVARAAGSQNEGRAAGEFSVVNGTTYAIRARFAAGLNDSGQSRVNARSTSLSVVAGPRGAMAGDTNAGGTLTIVSQTATEALLLWTANSASSKGFVGVKPNTTIAGHDIRLDGIDVVLASYNPSRWVSTTSPAPTTAADSTTIPSWQAFVEQYSLLSGLTIDATVNIRLTPSAARRILTIGTANDGFFLEQTTSNTIRAVLRASSADVWTMTSGAISAAGNRRVQVTVKPGANVLTVEGVTGASNSNATALPDAIRTEPAYVGRDIAGSLHWNGNIPSFKIGKAG